MLQALSFSATYEIEYYVGGVDSRSVQHRGDGDSRNVLWLARQPFPQPVSTPVKYGRTLSFSRNIPHCIPQREDCANSVATVFLLNV